MVPQVHGPQERRQQKIVCLEWDESRCFPGDGAAEGQNVYRFTTPECDVRMTVEFSIATRVMAFGSMSAAQTAIIAFPLKVKRLATASQIFRGRWLWLDTRFALV